MKRYPQMKMESPIPIIDRMAATLKSRKDFGKLRFLRIPELPLIDLCSNDYLGLARGDTPKHGFKMGGATGSRLLSGNTTNHVKLEAYLADFHQGEAALVFNSGYDANLGLLASVPQRGDTILYDVRCHASIKDGARLSLAQSFSYRHNDLGDLRAKLSRAHGQRFVVAESVYSMDGDLAPLEELVELCGEVGAALIIDEAHATGVYGTEGEGRVGELGIVDSVFARVHTFGKAVGAHGAVVVGSDVLRSFLINFAHSFIYTTALPPVIVELAQINYERLRRATAERSAIRQNISVFREGALSRGLPVLESLSPIQGIIIPGNHTVRAASRYLAEQGFDVRAIVSPTVPEGSERLRIILHSFNSPDEIARLLDTLALWIHR